MARVLLEPLTTPSSPTFARTFLLTAALCTIILPFATWAVRNDYNNPDVFWIQSLYQRKEIAARRAPPDQPRLFIVGGSGALFGVDAELMEKKLHCPVINFATHAGLGMEYLLDRARRALRPGDRVLLCPEYGLWIQPDTARDELAVSYISTYDKSFYAHMGLGRAAAALYSVPLADYAASFNGLWTRLRNHHHHFRATSNYNVAMMSPNGDLRAYFTPRRTMFSADLTYPFITDTQSPPASALRRFADWARDRHIQLLFSWPNTRLPNPPTPIDPPPIMTDFLRDCGFIILDTPADNAYPKPWFLDSDHHTNAACRRLRTEALIRRLRPHLGLPPAPDQPSAFFFIADPNHRLTPGNLFDDDPAVRVKYLTPTPLPHPDAITPSTAAEICRSGTPVYFDDPAAAQLLSSTGLTSTEIAGGTTSLAALFRAYPRHVFLLVRPAAGKTPPLTDPSIPAALVAALQSPRPCAALIGTGPYAAEKILLGDRRASLHGELADLLHRPALLPTEIQFSTSPSATHALVDNYELHPTNSPGLTVAVLEPEQGIIADYATFTDSPQIPAWHLYQALPPPPR